MFKYDNRYKRVVSILTSINSFILFDLVRTSESVTTLLSLTKTKHRLKINWMETSRTYFSQQTYAESEELLRGVL